MAYLTVIVTVYNIDKYLERFYNSLSAQTFKDFTVLFINDGSSDDSLKVCKRFAQEDSRVEIVNLEHVGISKARNISMEYIKTPFAVHADGDDFVEPDYLLHLVEAQRKYDADLVISRVKYLNESETVIGEHPKTGECFIPRSDYKKTIPQLIRDRRLNYLYAKIFRTEIFKKIRVDDDVRQGSDTMINCQYLLNCKSIVLIDDLDYNYIKYTSRSVTSYAGTDGFDRLIKINRFIYDCLKGTEYWSDELLRVHDTRVLDSAEWSIERVLNSSCSKNEKISQINRILSEPYYVEALRRTQIVVNDRCGEKIVKDFCRAQSKEAIKTRIISFFPKSWHNFYLTLFRRNV